MGGMIVRSAGPRAVVVVLILLTLVALPRAAGAQQAVPWTDLLPPLPSGYEPSREHLCLEGQPSCVDVVIGELQRRLDPLVAACDDDLVFDFTYLRTTEQYRRTITADPAYFQDPAHINHQDTVFAAYFFEQDDAWRAGDSGAVSPAWRIAFDAADRRAVSATGNLFLAMNAHINRDMPFVLESIGLTYADGSSGKPDHDKSNRWLLEVSDPMLAEAARRFDPTLDDGDVPYTDADTTLSYQLVAAWRERAWRNAERLHAARALGPDAAAQVAAQIEAQAATEGQAIAAVTATDDAHRAARQAYCEAHRYDP
jgi:hypothetical protein